MRIAILDKVHPALAERLVASGHEILALHDQDNAQLASALTDVQVAVVRSRKLTAAMLRGMPGLHVVGRVGAGLENIDLAYCKQHNIRVINSPEGNRDGVGEMCVLLLLAAMKHLCRADAQVRTGQWNREENRGNELQGRTVGIIGYGHMGRAFAEKLAGFGVRILAHDKYVTGFGSNEVTESSLDDLLAASEVISLHLPLNDETRHYANASFFARLAHPIWFINTSRGQVVDTEALLYGLDSGSVTAAGLDVLEYERADLSGIDPSPDPRTLQRLLAHDRVVLTPHVGGVTHEGNARMASILADKILTLLRNG